MAQLNLGNQFGIDVTIDYDPATKQLYIMKASGQVNVSLSWIDVGEVRIEDMREHERTALNLAYSRLKVCALTDLVFDAAWALIGTEDFAGEYGSCASYKLVEAYPDLGFSVWRSPCREVYLEIDAERNIRII